LIGLPADAPAGTVIFHNRSDVVLGREGATGEDAGVPWITSIATAVCPDASKSVSYTRRITESIRASDACPSAIVRLSDAVITIGYAPCVVPP
jgi:hypothetical protein